MSRLKATKPVIKKNRLKLFLYGDAKVGKTTLALSFPKAYIIDTEQTTDKKKYVNLINKNEGQVFETQNFDDLIDQVQALLTEKHDYKTLVIDSLTNLYGDLVDKSEMKVGSTAFGKHTYEAAKQMKRLFNLLYRLDMNVIITSHAKDKYIMGKDSNGRPEMTHAGTTFDCFKKLDYLFDLILEIVRRADQRIVIVRGTRLDEFVENETFQNNYDEFSSRYDKEIMEKESVAQVFATPEQLKKLKTLFEALDVSEKSKSAWLVQLKAGAFDEASEEGVQKLLDKLTEKLNEKLAA